MVTEALL